MYNHAGATQLALLGAVSTPDEDWDLSLSVNLTAPFVLSRAALPHMLAQGHGVIINTISEADRWAENAELYWSETPFRGREALRATFRGHTHAPSVFHKHFLIEPRIKLDGDSATVDSLFARLDAFPDGSKGLAYGRYRDVLIRCGDGRWRFLERRAEVEAQGTPPEVVIAAARAGSDLNRPLNHAATLGPNQSRERSSAGRIQR